MLARKSEHRHEMRRPDAGAGDDGRGGQPVPVDALLIADAGAFEYG
jgi:hypothetical protein